MKIARNIIRLLPLITIFVLALGGCSNAPASQVSVGPQGIPGTAGIGVSGASVNSAGHLILTLSNSQTIDAGLTRSILLSRRM